MKLKLEKSIQILTLILLVFLFSCSEEIGPEPLEKNTNSPGQVENVTIENLPGKARLTYSLPNDKDLLYIKAKYTLENGTDMEVKTSYYNNSLLLEGFKGLSESEVSIYAVNRSEVESSPVIVKVNPLKAVIYDVYDSMITYPDFGGLRIKADNPKEEDLAILVMQENVQGDWEPLPTSIYTSQTEIDQALRGFDTISQKFAIALRDRWLNVTDTLFTEVKPLYEKLMPKSDFLGVNLDNDTQVIGTYPVSNLWDGEFIKWWGSYFTSRTVDVGPHLVTFDIGAKTKLSRLKIWHFPEPIDGLKYFYLGVMKKFRIWGSNELNTDGNLDKWTLLGDYEVVKPSGLPYGQESNEDYLAAKDGNDYEISIDMPAVRYLRIQCLENWAGGEFMAISEVNVYGNPN